VVLGLLADPSPPVRWRAAQGLLAARERAALPVLAALVREGPLPLAVRADELLACVAGPRAPRVFAEETPLRRARAPWDAWARGHAKIDLTHAEVDLPPFNPSLRAAAAARRFVAALYRNDLDLCKEATEVPFLVGGEQLQAGRADMDKFVASFVQNLRGQTHSVPVLWVRFPEGLVRTGTPAERAFLARLRKGDVRGVELIWQVPEHGTDAQGLTLRVRVAGESPRIVSLDPRR
jgi:hypothetical protein